MVANPQSGSSSTILDRIYNYYCKGSFRQVHYLPMWILNLELPLGPRPEVSHILQENISGIYLARFRE